MDQQTKIQMISDLENLGAWSGDEPERIPTVVELGADYLLASSPRRTAPAALHDRLAARIDQEPAHVSTDPEGRITAINPAFSGLCGFSFAEIRGKKPGTFLQGPETDPSAVDTIRQAVRNQEPCIVELVNYHKDGSRYWVRIEVQPVRDAVGRLTGFAATETQLDR